MSELVNYWSKTDREVHLPVRFKIIKESISEISDDDAKKLAENTMGLDSVDFYQAIEIYKSSKLFPHQNSEIAPIDILTDVPDEGDTSIERVFLEFRSRGFRNLSVYPDLYGSKRSRYLQPLAKIIPKLFFKLDIFTSTSVFLIKK